MLKVYGASCGLSDVEEIESPTKRWGDKLIFHIGGKMFSQLDFVAGGRAVLSFVVNPEIFDELIARERVDPLHTERGSIGSRLRVGTRWEIRN